jgi:hypothetical protein
MHQTKQLTNLQLYKDFEKNFIRESLHIHGFEVEVKETTTTLAMTPARAKKNTYDSDSDSSI